MLGLVDIEVKELERFGPRRLARFSTSYMGLHLHFPRILNINPQVTSNRYSPRIMVGADMYWCTVHMSTFYHQSMYTLAATVSYCHLTWLACIFFQHYSSPGLEFDPDLGQA